MAPLNTGHENLMKIPTTLASLFMTFLLPISAFAFEAEQQKQNQCPIEFKKVSQCASIEWRVAPKLEAFAEATIKFWSKKNGSPSGPFENPECKQLAVSLWMPEHGHGSSPIRLTIRETGIIDATKIYFSMAGLWELKILLKNGTQVVDQAIVSLSLTGKREN